jgi:anti-sigma regulatory factor (Ser/Thr protein kinase)
MSPPSQTLVSHSQLKGQTMVDEWPLRNYLELGALDSAVPCARLHARQVLFEWGLSLFSKDAELLVSELVTNAIQASRSAERIPPVGLWLLADRSRLLIQVWDSNPEPPARMEPDGIEESGRGLLLVEAIASKWDWQQNKDRGGKTVWALMEIQLAPIGYAKQAA